MAARGELPAWVNLGLIPLLNLAAAFLVSGLIVLMRSARIRSKPCAS